MGQINFKAISKEDLLVKMSMLRAENTLLRKQSVELGKSQSYILELENKIEKLKKQKDWADKKETLLSDAKAQLHNQANEIARLKELLDNDLVAQIKRYKDKIEHQRQQIYGLREKKTWTK